MNTNSNDVARLYKETSIKTADNGKIILMLYEKAIESLEIALSVLQEKDFRNYDVVNNKITHAQEIITELAGALNRDVAPDLCDNLLNIYLFFNKELSIANAQKQPEKIKSVKDFLAELLESWRVASQSSPSPTTSHNSGLNITG